MDIFSHGLYGGIAAGRKSKKNYLVALLFGMGPDLLAFGPLVLASLLGFHSWIGNGYIHYIYNATHSFIVFVPLLILFYIFGGKNFAKLTLAWPLHILVDIPTHSVDFFPTHFLWPISDFFIDGIAWATPIIFFPNIAILLTIYLYWYVNKKHSPNN